MKLLVDMNLSPSWVERRARYGFETLHWSTIGAATAPDAEILTWAKEQQFVVVTNDLDFSAILAASGGRSPSVVQIRMQDLLSEEAVTLVAEAIDTHRENIERGALLSINEAGTRVRILPFKRLQDRSQLLSRSASLKGDLAGMLSAARDSKRSPDPGDLLVHIKLVAGARNQRYLQLWSGAA